MCGLAASLTCLISLSRLILLCAFDLNYRFVNVWEVWFELIINMNVINKLILAALRTSNEARNRYNMGILNRAMASFGVTNMFNLITE